MSTHNHSSAESTDLIHSQSVENGGSRGCDTNTGTTPVLEVQGLRVEIAQGFRRIVHAVSGVDLSIAAQETLGLVGESGCGKTTTGKAIAGLVKPTGGRVTISGTDLTKLKGRSLRKVRNTVQMIFQDPISSLNPRRKILNTIMEPMAIWSIGSPEERRARALELLQQVGLEPHLVANRLPYQLSGGQCQRVSVARALTLSPDLLICDEPVSALDVSVQAHILNLLNDIQRTYRLSMLFISHDLSVVRNVSDRVAVMYMGRICEVAPVANLFDHPMHPYTLELLRSIPVHARTASSTGMPAVTPAGTADVSVPDLEPIIATAGNRPSTATGSGNVDVERPDAQQPFRGWLQAGIQGPIDSTLPDAASISSALSPPSGCRYHPRCPHATSICTSEQPPMMELSPDHTVACHHPLIQPVS